MDRKYHLKNLRGPFLVSIALTWVILPPLLRLPTMVLLQLAILGVGSLCCLYDLLPLLERQCRNTMQWAINSVVLDDVLRAIYDPETGLVASVVGTFVGASTMYALRLDADQRTKLVQSSLWVSNEEAHSILHQPGGCQNLLPESMQSWLYSETEVEATNPKASKLQDEDGQDSDSFETECTSIRGDAADELSERVVITSRGLSFDEEQSTQLVEEREGPIRSETDQKVPLQDPPPAIPEDPVTVMFSIVGEMMYEKLKRQAIAASLSISRNKVENVAISAAVALFGQMFLRRRSATTFLGSVSAFALSGTAVTAFSGILAREIALGNIHDKESLQLVLQASIMRISARIKAAAKNGLPFRRILAFFVLALAGRRGTRRSTDPLIHPVRP